MTNDHNLYKNGDLHLPECILDRNGQVVLALCKVCGGGESELDESCESRQIKIKWIAAYVQRMVDCGVDRQHAQDNIDSVGDNQYDYIEDDPEQCADDEMSYWHD